MRDALLKHGSTRRFFIGWLVAAAPAVIGVPLFRACKSQAYFRLGREFLVVDGWVLPASHFD